MTEGFWTKGSRFFFRPRATQEGNASSEALPRRARSEPPRRAPLADDVLSEKMQEMQLTQWLQRGCLVKTKGDLKIGSLQKQQKT